MNKWTNYITKRLRTTKGIAITSTFAVRFSGRTNEQMNKWTNEQMDKLYNQET